MTPERIYAALLTLYPRGFRDAYGPEMLQSFSEMRRASHRPRPAFWCFALGDLATSVFREQLDACRSGLRRFVLQWLAICAFGAMGTSLVAFLVTQSFAYLYHPYLEGLRFSPWSYGAFLGAGLGLAQAVALRQRRRIATAWVAVSTVSAAIGFDLAALTAGAIGPVGCGLAIGAVVGGCQWWLSRTLLQRPGWPVLGSGLSLPAIVLLCDNLIQRALSGVNPVAADVHATLAGAHASVAFDALVRGLQQPRSWADAAFELTAIATTGLTIGVITARQLSEMHRAR